MTTNVPNFTPNELVWYEKDGQIHSSGYKVESLFKTLGIAPMTTMNEPMSGGSISDSASEVNDNGGQFSDLFRFMGVPAGLSAIISENVVGDHNAMTGGRKTTSNKDDFDIHRVERGLISSSLFDRLTELAGPDDNVDDSKNEKKPKIHTNQKKRVTRRLRVKESSKSGKKRTTRRNRRV